MSSNVRPESMARINTEALAKAFIDEQVTALREQIGDKKVLLALSGGVDSSVVAKLLEKAVGSQLTCIFVDHGLMRKNEGDEVEAVFGHFQFSHVVRIHLVVQRMLACVLQDACDFEGDLPQFHRYAFSFPLYSPGTSSPQNTGMMLPVVNGRSSRPIDGNVTRTDCISP